MVMQVYCNNNILSRPKKIQQQQNMSKFSGNVATQFLKLYAPCLSNHPYNWNHTHKLSMIRIK